LGQVSSQRSAKRRAAERGLGQRRGVHDPVQAGLDRRLVGFADLVQQVADLVRPTALDGDIGECRGQGSEQAAATINAEYFQVLSR
jgi:hypothetical protein